MNIHQSNVVRFASTTFLTAAVALGTHAFVPAAAYGAQPGSSDCKTSGKTANPDGTIVERLGQLGNWIYVLKVLLP